MKLSTIKNLFLATFITCLMLSESQAQVCRVSTSGTALGSGSSWDDTVWLVWALIDTDNCKEIWVKSGTYYPTADSSRSASFNVKNGVKLYGGFYGFETNRDERDPINNKAILSGDIGARNVASDNSFHVVNIDTGVSAVPGSTTTIDGVIISNGYSEFEEGGGLVCDANGSGKVCDAHLKNIEFKDNVALDGGAIYLKTYNGGSNRSLIELVQFTNNRTLSSEFNGSGGAIYIDTLDGINRLRIFDSEFKNNYSHLNGGAITVSTYDDSDSKPIIANSTFFGNTSKNGGAYYSKNSGSHVPVPVDEMEMYNTTFNNNSSLERGGAIFLDGGEMNLNNITLSDNSAGESGGGINVEQGELESLNNILWGNQAPSGSQLFSVNGNITANYNVIQNNCTGFAVDLNTLLNCQNNQTSNPILGPLQNNQSSTQTMLLGPGSSALDNGNNLTCINDDQRNISRPQNGQCDIGAVEMQNVCRVTTTGTNGGNGSDWTNQAMTLQSALSVSGCPKVKIKAGIYKPTSSSDRTISFNIPEGVTVEGGFDGTIENENEPNTIANPVILSGDIGVIGEKTDNTYHVVKLNGHLGTKILPSTIVIGLQIHDGYSSQNIFDYPNNSGAGMYCIGSGSSGECSPTLINVKFVNNHAIAGSGGGVFNNADNDGRSSPQMINVVFENNSAFNGGAMYNFGNNRGHSSPIVINGVFAFNSAVNSGGAVYNYAYEGRSSGTFLFGQFLNNFANYGGAIYSSGQELGISNPIFNQLFFISNSANIDGGAFYSAGYNDGQSMPLIENVTFQLNSAQRGGAMFLNDLAGNGTAEINRVTFDQNSATDGGAIYNDGENGYSHPKLTNVTFYSNSASNNGGAIYNNGDNGVSSPTITNTTFKDNQANYGGAMYSSGDGLNGSSNATMRNIIMWNNQATTDGPTVYHNLAESSTYDSVIEFGCPNYGAGNTNCDNIITNDPLLGPLLDNGGHTNTFLPANNSSAINAGDNDYCPGEDQRGNARPNGSTCDIGSVEVDFQGPTDIIFKDGFE